jgi:predicted nucleic acid-binding protein
MTLVAKPAKGQKAERPLMPVFFDTNVLAYCTDPRDKHKQGLAQQLVQRASLHGDGIVSTQVLIELYQVLGHKLRVPDVQRLALIKAYTAWPVIAHDLALITAAMEKSVRHEISLFDAMVVEAALRSGATTLHSEDMPHGQRFGALTLINPFL